jgi:RNA polymerase sigma factor (sigma-70 family)
MQTNDKLSRVYLDSRPALQRFLVIATNCPDTAADLVQELYLRLPLLNPIPSSDIAIRAWMFRVAANLAVDNFRKTKRQNELLLEHANNTDNHSITRYSPEARVLTQDQLLHLELALEELPPLCSQILYLSRIEGLPHQAIAEQLGISKSWVEKQLVRAIAHLRKTIDND